jgi:glycosyltransferase involved in cell wall biosynthesis
MTAVLVNKVKTSQDFDVRPDRPRVTIAIPCFKQEAFLFECLNSLITQTMPSWQAFVVDDCSPAATAQQIASSYNDPRIRCIRHDVNRGLGASRNTGLQAGYAPFVLCIDADDFLHRDFLSATLEAIENRRANCAYTAFQCFGLSNDVWFNQEPKSAGDLAREQWLPGAGVTMLRSVWEAVGGYSHITYNEDWDFWIAALQLDISVAHVPRPLYFYRRHRHSATATQPDRDRTTREGILKRHPAFFAVGNRKKVFRAGGFIRAARAHRALGHRMQWAVLTARAISVDPRLIYPETKAIAWTLGRKVRRKIKSIAISLGIPLTVLRRAYQSPNSLSEHQTWSTTAERARMNLVVYDAKNEELSSIDLHCTRWESKAGMYVNAVPFLVPVTSEKPHSWAIRDYAGRIMMISVVEEKQIRSLSAELACIVFAAGTVTTAFNPIA